jgi:hypothetical protein
MRANDVGDTAARGIAIWQPALISGAGHNSCRHGVKGLNT